MPTIVQSSVNETRVLQRCLNFKSVLFGNRYVEWFLKKKEKLCYRFGLSTSTKYNVPVVSVVTPGHRHAIEQRLGREEQTLVDRDFEIIGIVFTLVYVPDRFVGTVKKLILVPIGVQRENVPQRGRYIGHDVELQLLDVGWCYV